MIAILIYWTLQIAIWMACILIFVRRKKIAAKNKGRKDSTVQKVLMLTLTPVFAFAYVCMGGYPPKDDQVYFILAVTVVIYGALIARWARQYRQATQ